MAGLSNSNPSTETWDLRLGNAERARFFRIIDRYVLWESAEFAFWHLKKKQFGLWLSQQTGLIYRPSASFPPVPESPTKVDAAKALSLLMQVLADLPMFQEADRSAWLSIVLSMIGRSCIDG
ncbi:MAG: hypothetical protein ABL921_07445 [Pirellula sp.]